MSFRRNIMVFFILITLVSMSILDIFERDPVTVSAYDGLDDNVIISSDWSVTGTETYSGDNITLEGNLTISGTLILSDVELMLNSSDDNPLGIEVRSGGSLICRNNTIISGVNESRYHFYAESGSTVAMDDTLILNCGISSSSNHSRMGLYIRNGQVTLNNTIISTSSFGIIMDGGTLVASNLTISNMEHCGISLENGSLANISGMTMILDHGYGLCSYFSSITMRSSTINSINSSLYLMDSSLNAYQSLFNSQNVTSRVISSFVDAGDCVFLSGISTSFSLELPRSVPSSVRLLDSTIEHVAVTDPTGWLRGSFRTDIRVVTNGGAPASGADIAIEDNKGDVVFSSDAGPAGVIEDIAIVSTFHNITGSHDQGPHKLKATYNGATRTVTFSVPVNQEVFLEILIDTPSITFIHPAQGQWLDSGDLLFNCLIEDHGNLSSVSIVIDGGSSINIGRSKEIVLDLSMDDGEHSIEVIATDMDMFIGRSTLNFNIDTISPVIRIDEPDEGAYFNVTTIWVKGSCSQDSHLWVNDSPTNITGGRFNTTVHLKEGANRITLFAKDRAGNTDTRTVNVYRDTTDPYLFVESPADGTLTGNRTLRVRGYTDQGTVRVTVNKGEASLKDGIFDHELSDLKEGSNRIVITAHDLTGSMTTITRRVTLDTTPPGVSLTRSPAVIACTPLTIEGITDPDASLWIDGWPYEVDNGTFSVEIEYLSEGQNIIRINVEDKLGNSASLEYRVYLDKTSPDIVSIVPRSNSHVTNSIQVITGEAYDDFDLFIVRGRVQGGLYKDLEGVSNWKWVVDLKPGMNILEVQALDTVGNERTVQLVYYLDVMENIDTTFPVIDITKPLNNTIFTEEGVINFEGTAYDDWELSEVLARIDGGNWTLLEGKTLWHISYDLRFGSHKMEVKAVDTSGNVGHKYVVIRVIPPAEAVREDERSVPDALILVSGLFLLTLVFVFGFLLYNNIKLRRTYSGMDEVERDVGRRSPDRAGERRKAMPSVRGPPVHVPGKRGDSAFKGERKRI